MAEDKSVRVVEVEKGYPGKANIQEGYKGPTSTQSKPPVGGSGVVPPASTPAKK